MAVTKIWDVKSRLDHVIDYVTDPEKTYNAGYDDGEQKYFVTAMNCNATCAKRQFQNVKKQFSKTSGIIAYHGYQSFAPGEVSAQEAHRIGVELANELWSDRFQVIVSTHVNTDCIHNHLLFNSVSFKDGKKYHDCRDAYRKMRETSDRICREHGLSMIEDPESRKDPSNLHRMDKAGMPTRYNVTRQAVDEAIAKSSNLHEPEVFRLYSALSGKPQILDGDPERMGKTHTPCKAWRRVYERKDTCKTFRRKASDTDGAFSEKKRETEAVSSDDTKRQAQESRRP